MIKILTTAATILLLFGALAFAADTSKHLAVSQTSIGEAPDAVAIDLATVPHFSRADAKNYRRPPKPRNPYYTDEQLRVIKKAAITAPATHPRDAAYPVLVPRKNPVESQTPMPFAGFPGSDQTCAEYTPSDMGIAVNTGWVVQVTDACVQITNKTGGDPVTYTLNSILGWPGGTFTSDPRILFDFVRSRFVVVASTVDSDGTAWLDVSVTKTNDPHGTWYYYHLSTPAGTTAADFPTLGQTWANDKFNGVIVACYNQFTSAGFQGANCLFLPKTKLYAGGHITYNILGGFLLGNTLLDTLQPVDVSQSDEQPRTEYAVASINTNDNANGLVIWSFANTVYQPNSPGPYWTASTIATPSSYSYPADANNAGYCSHCIETLDNRITGMVQYSGGRLFPTINTANGGTSGILGWVVRPYLNDNGGPCSGTYANACPGITGATIETEFCYDCAGGDYGAYFGTIAADEDNDWTMFANYSDLTYSPSTFYTSNRVSVQTPFHDGGQFACQNNADYSQIGWGEYTAAAPDYKEYKFETAIWGSGMYVENNGNWGTCISATRYDTIEIP
jgi:hypothetical protein